MRLLNTNTAKLKTFFGKNIPPYAILSHTWHKDNEEEILFEDVQREKETYFNKQTIHKFKGALRTASQDGFEWIWIDTCCIDKSSSTELTEAINSMFKWYAKAHSCYVYLEDVIMHDDEQLEGFESARWFSRGWTLQELLAPPHVEFYDMHWREFGTKMGLHKKISTITGISQEVVLDNNLAHSLDEHVAAERMSWAARRTTTREEDMAYCLLGIFGVNMPTLYGEGNRAFHRLQEEILKVAEDYTLLAWTVNNSGYGHYPTVLATSPSDFDSTSVDKLDYTQIEQVKAEELRVKSNRFVLADVRKLDADSDIPPRLTARGFHAALPIIQDGNRILAFLQCVQKPDGQLICISLRRHNTSTSEYTRKSARPVLFSRLSVTLNYKILYIGNWRPFQAYDENPGSLNIRITDKFDIGTAKRVTFLFAGNWRHPISGFQNNMPYHSDMTETYYIDLQYGSFELGLYIGYIEWRYWCHLTKKIPESDIMQNFQIYQSSRLSGSEIIERDSVKLDSGCWIRCSMKLRSLQWRSLLLDNSLSELKWEPELAGDNYFEVPYFINLRSEPKMEE
jgi:Heterokaryon incompatibility protein (HET)